MNHIFKHPLIYLSHNKKFGIIYLSYYHVMLKVTKYAESENNKDVILPSMKDVQYLAHELWEKVCESTPEIKIKSLTNLTVSEAIC